MQLHFIRVNPTEKNSHRSSYRWDARLAEVSDSSDRFPVEPFESKLSDSGGYSKHLPGANSTPVSAT